MVVWLIGLSGSGKTTLATEVVELIRQRGRKVILLDGDKVRDLFGNDLGHNLEDRKRNAKRIIDLCTFFDNQDIDVVCAVLSISLSSQDWCRNNFSQYFEVFIDVPIKTLIGRDPKNIYKDYYEGKSQNVVGLDIEFPKPINSDLVIENTKSLAAFLEHAPLIADLVCGDPA